MSISVVIPAYNAFAFIAETLDSVLQQTFPPDEILVIDDGSTDDTASIAESFGPPVRVFRRPNSRQGASRNFGVQKASCEWIAFIDADDLWEPNKLERQMTELASHPEADLCYTDHERFAIEGRELRYFTKIPFCSPDQLGRLLFQRCAFQLSSVIVRRSTFLEVGGFATDFKVCEDWDLWLRLFNMGKKFVACPERLLLYRMHGANVSFNTLARPAEDIRIYREHILPNLSGHSNWRAYFRVHSLYNAEQAYSLRNAADPRYLSVM